MTTLDRSRPFGTLYGSKEGLPPGAYYTQDGEYFTFKGELTGEATKANPAPKPAKTDHSSADFADNPLEAIVPPGQVEATVEAEASVETPSASWRDLHWTKQVKLAENHLGRELPQTTESYELAKRVLEENLG